MKKNFLSKEIDNEKAKKVALYLLAFFIPVIILIAIFIYLKVYPFGDNTYLPVDAFGQYISFFQYFKNIFMGDNSIFYSLGKSIGGEMYGLFAYYLLSPYNFVTLLFEKGNMTLAFDIIMILKIASSSLAMVFYLNRKKEANFTNLIFGIMYSFSAYVVTYGFNVMWLDGIILLPFIISGLEDLIEFKKIGLYTITLSLCIIINYYIGFMVCIFVFIYFVYKLLIESRSLKETMSIIRIFIFSSICAVLISGIIIIPVFLGLQNGRADFSFSSFNLDKNFEIQSILSKFRTNSFNINDIKNDGLPPIFCGTFANIFIILYFLNKKIKIKEKNLSLIVILIFLLSFYINGFNLLWTMGNVSAWYIYRYAFCFTFFYIILGWKRIQ